MIRSMTGYGRARQAQNGRDVTVELKAVNHRFFEFSARLPRSLTCLEDKLKSAVGKRVSRGKTDVSVSVVTEGGNVGVEVNSALARGYLESIRGLGAELGLEDDVTLSSLMRFGEIFDLRKLEEDESALWSAVAPVLDEALGKFVAMRETEGEKLREDVLSRLDAIESHLAGVEERSPKAVEDYRARLYQKLYDVLADQRPDDARVLTEAAIFAEKTAVAEETVRLRSHISQFRQIVAAGGEVGRKLDFLVQEMNRETNTIGSKAQDIELARLVVEIKSEIEKIREQIQNIE